MRDSEAVGDWAVIAMSQALAICGLTTASAVTSLRSSQRQHARRWSNGIQPGLQSLNARFYMRHGLGYLVYQY